MATCKAVKYPIIIDCTGEVIEISNIPVKSTQTFTSTGLLTSFSFNHGFGAMPSYVGIEALTEDAMDYAYITYNSTSVTIKYLVAPPVGVSNLIFNAIIE